MVALFNGAEGGTLGATVSAANSDNASGNAWNSVVGTPTITFDNTQAIGTQSYKIVNPPSAQQMVWSTSLGTVTEVWGRLYLYSSAAPSGVTGIVRFLSGGSQSARLRYETAGTLTISDAGNATEITTTNAVATSQWTRIEYHIIFDAVSATCEIKLFNNAWSLTPTETKTTTTAAGLGANCDTVQFGAFNSCTWTAWLDGIAIHNDSSIGYLGPYRLPPAHPGARRPVAMTRAAVI